MKTQSSYSSSTSLFRGRIDDCLSGDVQVRIAGLPEKQAYKTWDGITTELSSLDKTFNAQRQGSETALLNASKVDISTSETLKEALNLGEDYLVRTQGYFDVAKGGEKLDFGAFAKGFALRRIAAILKKNKVRNYLVLFEGSLAIAQGKGVFDVPWTFAEEGAQICDEALAVCGGGFLTDPHGAVEKDFTRRLCSVRGKDPLDAKVLGIALLLAGVGKDAVLAEFPGYSVEFEDL